MSIVTCPNCKMRVIAKADGKCPSCRADLTSIVLALENTPESKPDEATPHKMQKVAESPFSRPKKLAKEQPTEFDVVHVLFSFRGRIPRSVSWHAWILAPLMLIVIFVLARALLGEDSQLLGWIILPLGLAMLWMWFAIGIKRLHDLNWTGWLIVIGLIPSFGPSFMLITAGMMRGTRGPNRYGPDPLKLLN